MNLKNVLIATIISALFYPSLPLKAATLLELMKPHHNFTMFQLRTITVDNSFNTHKELKDFCKNKLYNDLSLYLKEIVTEKDYEQCKAEIKKVNETYKNYYGENETFASFWLRFCVKKNDTPSAIKFLKIGTSVNSGFRTPYLFRAIKHENTTMCKALLYFNCSRTKKDVIKEINVIEKLYNGTITPELSKKYLQCSVKKDVFTGYPTKGTPLEYAQYLYEKNNSEKLSDIIKLLSLEDKELQKNLDQDMKNFLETKKEEENGCVVS